jgi:hypothetical protein
MNTSNFVSTTIIQRSSANLENSINRFPKSSIKSLCFGYCSLISWITSLEFKGSSFSHLVVGVKIGVSNLCH